MRVLAPLGLDTGLHGEWAEWADWKYDERKILRGEQMDLRKAAYSLGEQGLDEVVHEAASLQATQINNSGIDVQLVFLLKHYTREQLRDIINDLHNEIVTKDMGLEPINYQP